MNEERAQSGPVDSCDGATHVGGGAGEPEGVGGVVQGRRSSVRPDKTHPPLWVTPHFRYGPL